MKVGEPERGERSEQATLPDVEAIRFVQRLRLKRDEVFGAELFVDPAWSILLDLAEARAQHRGRPVDELCQASGASVATALRWIDLLIARGMIEEIGEGSGRGKAMVFLTDRALDAMARFFSEAQLFMDRTI